MELLRSQTPPEAPSPLLEEANFTYVDESQAATTMPWNHPYAATLMEAGQHQYSIETRALTLCTSGVHSCIQPPSFMNDMSTAPPDIQVVSNSPTPAPTPQPLVQVAVPEDSYDNFDTLEDINSKEWDALEEDIRRLLVTMQSAIPSNEESYSDLDDLEGINSEEWRTIERDVKRLLPAPFIIWNDQDQTRTKIPWVSELDSQQNKCANVCSKAVADAFMY